MVQLIEVVGLGVEKTEQWMEEEAKMANSARSVKRVVRELSEQQYEREPLPQQQKLMGEEAVVGKELVVPVGDVGDEVANVGDVSMPVGVVVAGDEREE